VAAATEFAGYRLPAEVIVLAVRWYLRYGRSYRDVEELLAERGIVVDHVSVYQWVQRFTPLLVDAARPCRHSPGVDLGRVRRREPAASASRSCPSRTGAAAWASAKTTGPVARTDTSKAASPPGPLPGAAPGATSRPPR